MRKINIYIIGVAVLGLTWEWLQAKIGGALALATALGYLLLVRFVAERLGKG